MIKYRYPRFDFGKREEDVKHWARSRYPLLGLIVIILAAGYVSIISNFFKVSDIEVIGVEEYEKEKIMGLALARLSRRRAIIFKESSLFFYAAKGLEEDIRNNLPIESAELNKDFPNKLLVRVDRMKDILTAFLMIGTSTASKLGSATSTMPNTGEYEDLRLHGIFMLDKYGKILRRIEDDREKMMPIIEMNALQLKTGESGQQLIAQDSASFILGLHKSWPNMIGLGIDKYVLKDLRPTEIVIMTGEGWEAIFSILHPYEKQLEKLKIFLNEKFPKQAKRKGVRYIDLKTPDKIFWK